MHVIQFIGCFVSGDYKSCQEFKLNWLNKIYIINSLMTIFILTYQSISHKTVFISNLNRLTNIFYSFFYLYMI